MPNVIDQNGITIQTLAEILDEILNGTVDFPGMYQIYGPDINVLPNSPDGQMINIFAQAKLDMLELIQQIYTSFDPDQAVGVQLDQRCALNGVVRNAGTYTVTNVTVTVTQAITLPGLDTAPDAPFTVSDASGNQYQLIAAHVFGGAGSIALAFRSATLGAVTPALNTITNIVTLLLGVASVNNPSAATSIGTDEESDFSLRIRRANATAVGSKGYLAGLYGALGNVTGVTASRVLENIPAHWIWVVVAGGSDADVADAIYIKRNAGVGLIGSVAVPVVQIDGTIFPVLFDRPSPQDLWVSINVIALTGFVDDTFIRSQILALAQYSIGASADASSIVALVKGIAPNASITDEGLSTDGTTYLPVVAPTAFNWQFSLSADRVIINGVAG